MSSESAPTPAAEDEAADGQAAAKALWESLPEGTPVFVRFLGGKCRAATRTARGWESDDGMTGCTPWSVRLDEVWVPAAPVPAAVPGEAVEWESTWEPEQGWQAYSDHLLTQLDRVRVVAAGWLESPFREAQKAGRILSAVLAAPVPAAVPGEPEAPATNGPPSGWTADGEGRYSPPAAPGWAEGQRAEITWNDDSIVPSPMLATWHGGAWYAGQGDGYMLAQGRIASVTPLSPVPVGHVVINPAEALGLADEWHEAAQAVTNTDPASLARRAVYLRCAADLRAVRGLAGEKP